MWFRNLPTLSAGLSTRLGVEVGKKGAGTIRTNPKCKRGPVSSLTLRVSKQHPPGRQMVHDPFEVSFPGSAWERAVRQAPPGFRRHARRSLGSSAFPGMRGGASGAARSQAYEAEPREQRVPRQSLGTRAWEREPGNEKTRKPTQGKDA